MSDYLGYPLGQGTYGSAYMNNMATKHSIEQGAGLQPESITEVSILKHLNSHQGSCQTTLDHNPFPLVYACQADCKIKGSVTSLMMEFVGVTFNRLAATSPNPSTTIIELITEHYSQIIEAIRIMHACGVVHCDLHIGNITLDRQGKVRIIDFGLSCLGSMKSRLSYSAPGPIELPSADLWKLAGSIVRLHNGEPAYPDRDWAYGKLTKTYSHLDRAEIRRAIDQGRDYVDDHGNEIELIIPIPDSIPQPLHQQLQTMLSIVPSRRNYYPSLIPIIPIRRWNTTISRDHLDSFTHSLSLLLNKYKNYESRLSCYNVVVGIDLLCRIFRAIDYTNDSNLIICLVLAIVSLSIDRYIDMPLIKALLIAHGTDNLANYQLQVLELVDWRIFTRENTAIESTNVGQFINRILTDSENGSYVTLSSTELMARLEQLAD